MASSLNMWFSWLLMAHSRSRLEQQLIRLFNEYFLTYSLPPGGGMHAFQILLISLWYCTFCLVFYLYCTLFLLSFAQLCDACHCTCHCAYCGVHAKDQTKWTELLILSEIWIHVRYFLVNIHSLRFLHFTISQYLTEISGLSEMMDIAGCELVRQ